MLNDISACTLAVKLFKIITFSVPRVNFDPM